MKEVIFEIIEDIEGGYSASALGYPIHTQGDTAEELRNMIRDAVDCYFEKPMEKPHVLRLHFVRDEVLTA